jgi:hypothetical protein
VYTCKNGYWLHATGVTFANMEAQTNANKGVLDPDCIIGGTPCEHAQQFPSNGYWVYFCGNDNQWHKASSPNPYTDFSQARLRAAGFDRKAVVDPFESLDGKPCTP